MDVSEIDEKLSDEMFQSLIAGIIANRVKLITSLPFLNNLLKVT